MAVTRLNNREALAFRRLLKGAMLELGVGRRWLGDVICRHGGPLNLRATERALFERHYVNGRAAIRAMNCVISEARRRGMVLRTKSASGLVFGGFEVGRPFFQPAEVGTEGLTLDQLRRTVFTETNVSAIYYLRAQIAARQGIALAENDAERIQDDATLRSMLSARRREFGYHA